MLFLLIGGVASLASAAGVNEARGAGSGPVQEAAEVPPLTSEEVRQLMEQLTPDPDAPWRSVTWRVDLLAAQREAAETGRPLFIWAMDGHPLGCT